MSFKREGDDKNLLNNLRRRRINELLGEDVPEDEAKLLCNGRFACLVCGHNPVFDTVNMLRVHRQGKKHAANDAVFLRKKKELQALILNRKHEQYLKDGTTNIRQAAGTSSGAGIVNSQPYDPSVKKRRPKPYDRKARLDLCSAPALSKSESVTAPVPTKHSHQLKNIFRPVQTRDFPVSPYVRKNATHTHTQSASSYQHNGNHNRSSSSLQSSPPQTPLDPQISQPLLLTTSSSSLHANAGIDTSAGINTSVGIDTHTPVAGGLDVQSGVDDGGVGNMRARCGGVGSGVETAVPADLEKKKLAQRYYQISGSGWKKDWDGKWIRDEEAEFDSDEEPPDLP